MSTTLVSFSDFNNDVRFQQQKTRSQSMSMFGMPLEHQQQECRTRHGSSGSSSMLGSGSQTSTASMTMISQQLPPHGDATSLFGSNNTRSLNASAHLGSVNTAYNTANHNVPTAHRKLDRSISEPGDRNINLPSSKNQTGNINSTRYKTELCRPFEENGYCKYGDKCQFAHGSHEQRSLARHPKYKTELCRTFHTVGFCPYGPRCHFIHNEDERRLGQIVQMKQQQAAVQALQVQQAAAAQSTLQQIQQQLQHQQQQQSITLPPAISRSHSVSSPTPVQRPKTLNFSLSLNMPTVSRDTLGSTADSPPSSFTDSPTMSPSTLAEDFLAVSLALCNTPPASAPAAVTSAFTYPELGQALPSTPTPIMTPLNIHTDQAVVSLAAGLQAASLKNSSVTSDVLRDLNDSFYTPPSPPDSLNGDSIMNVCESPLDVSRNLRLPIFSRLANED